MSYFNFSSFIALRLYSDSNGKKRISRPAIRIAIGGIAIGLAVMIISISVGLGFKSEVSSKVIGFGSHIQVVSLTQTHEYEILPVITSDSLRKEIMKVPQVKHVQEYANKQGILKTEEDFLGVDFKGVGDNYDLSFFSKYLVEGKIPKFSAKHSDNEILISRTVASSLGIGVGDKVFSYFLGGESVRARRFTVKGIYETNLSEYDKNVVLTDIYTIRKLNNWESDCSSGYEIAIKDFSQVEQATSQLVDRVNHQLDRNGATYGAFSIYELSPHLFAWLDVLDMNVLIILILMMFVATFTIISGLLIIMLERIQMIGVLKALGATNMAVRRIFMNFATLLVGQGMLWGNVIGIALCYLQSQFAIIKLDAATYYIDAVPIQFNWLYIIGVNIVTLIVALIVIFGSSFLMSISRPTQTMKYE